VGKFDGEHPSLTCATNAGKIFFHTPHEKKPQDQVRFLNINRKISSLTCGTLDASLGRDVLFVGAQVRWQQPPACPAVAAGALPARLFAQTQEQLYRGAHRSRPTPPP